MIPADTLSFIEQAWPLRSNNVCSERSSCVKVGFSSSEPLKVLTSAYSSSLLEELYQSFVSKAGNSLPALPISLQTVLFSFSLYYGETFWQSDVWGTLKIYASNIKHFQARLVGVLLTPKYASEDKLWNKEWASLREKELNLIAQKDTLNAA